MILYYPRGANFVNLSLVWTWSSFPLSSGTGLGKITLTAALSVLLNSGLPQITI